MAALAKEKEEREAAEAKMASVSTIQYILYTWISTWISPGIVQILPPP